MLAHPWFDPQAGWLWGLISTNMISCVGADSIMCNLSQQDLVSTDIRPLDIPLLQLNGSCSDIVWSLPLSVSVLGPLGRDSGAGQCRMLPLLGPSYLIGATKQFTVCGFLCWDLVCMGSAKLHTKVGFHEHESQSQVSKRSKAPLPPSSCLLGSSLKECLVVYKLCEVLSYQIRSSSFCQFDTDSNSAPMLNLRPLSKSPTVHQCQLPLPIACGPL